MNLKQWFKTKTALAIALAGFLLAALLPVQNGAEKTAYAAEDIEAALYNYEYYVKANDDVAKALNSDPDAMYNHWITCGMAEGRNASMVFNAKYYLEVNPEVAAAVGNDYVAAYNHFVTTGIYQGLESSPVFDVKYYLENNTDVANAFNNDKVMAAIHFNTSAIAEGRSGSGNFDYTVYSYCNTDVAELYGDDVIGYYIHYINHGRAEGRTGGFSSNGGSGSTGGSGSSIDRSAASYRIFDAKFYLERYPGLAGSVGTDPDVLYKYWLETGISLGQTASPVIIPEEYRLLNADVANAFGEDDAATINHFLTSGIFEGRTGSVEFDYTIYAYCNTDVAKEFADDKVGYYWHYVNHGKAENRTAEAVVDLHFHDYDENYVCTECGFEYVTEGLDYVWHEEEGYYAVRGIGTAKGNKLIIPREYNGKPVKYIYAYAFDGATNIKELLIPSSIEEIGGYAFQNCLYLEKIQYNAVKCKIYDAAGLFNKAGQNGSGVTVIFGSEVSEIPARMFSINAPYNENLTNIVKVKFNGNNVKKIGMFAFERTTKLLEVELPEGLTTIETYAFFESALKSVVIPSTVERLAGGAFSYCCDLEQVQFNAVECESVSHDIELGAFQYAGQNSDGIKLVFGSEVAIVPGYLCYSNETMYTNIKEVVFEGNKVKEIGAWAFSYCPNLTEIELPESVTKLNSYIFAYGGLKSIEIPANVQEMNSTLAYCECLEEVQYNAVDCEAEYVFSDSGKEETGITLTIGSEVTRIPDSFASAAKVAKIIFTGNHLEEIEEYAFYACDMLSELELPSGVILGSYAFYDCAALTKVTLADNTIIGSSVFKDCVNLAEVSIGEGVRSIGSKAFYGCNGLTNVACAEPTGWRIQYQPTEITGLDNPETAAEALKTYTDRWIRQ